MGKLIEAERERDILLGRLEEARANAARLTAALEKIERIEKRADDLRSSGMVDYCDLKAMRAMATTARGALYHCPALEPT